MTKEGNGQPIVYQIDIAKQVTDSIKQLHKDALKAGLHDEFITALRQIIDRLRKDPATFGEPRFGLPGMKVVVYQAAILPLVVEYAVHDEKPLVFLRGFKFAN